jgi:hypothetical protein
MIIVEDWIKNSDRSERTKHLDLSQQCIERGGNSTVHRGVLAQYLNTNFPSKVHLCHACHNDKCSNPLHLYWGTPSENIQDAKNNGTWTTAWEKSVEKYGYEEACQRNSRAKIGNIFGSGNKGKSKSQAHKDAISKTVTELHLSGHYEDVQVGRKKKGDVVKLANTPGLSPDAVRLVGSSPTIPTKQ